MDKQKQQQLAVKQFAKLLALFF